MVYDATRSRLNDSLWAPGFGLPIVDSLTRGIDEQTWMGDLDIGEMFLNFCLHPELQPYAGVDLRPFGSGGATLWERWTRCLMGLKSSPYFCIKGLLIALEFVRGNRDRPSNPFFPFSLFLSKFKIILTTSLYLAGMPPSLDV